MSDTLADRINAYIGTDPNPTPTEAALIAVLDKCEQIRVEAGKYPGWAHADDIEQVIARALGINND